MSNTNVTIKVWKDKHGTPRITFSYENPELLYDGNDFNGLHARKMIRDYLNRKDVAVETKRNVLYALEILSKSWLAETIPSEAEIRADVKRQMIEKYNVAHLLEDEVES